MSEPSTIVALDIATTCGVAEWAPDAAAPRFYSVRFAGPGDEHASTFTRARRWIDDRLCAKDVAALYVETTNLGALVGHTTIDVIERLVGLNAVIASAAGVWRIKYRKLDVHAVRAAFLGNGRLKREEAKPRAYEMARAIGWMPETLDEADAAAVLHVAISKEHPRLVPLISPMLQHQVATSAENAKILREQQKREKRMQRA